MSASTTVDELVDPAATRPGATADPHPLVGRFRQVLLGLAGATTVATALELAMLRHWDGFDQLIPWFILGVVGVTVVALAVRPAPLTVHSAPLVGLLAGAGGLYGALEHIHSNYESGPLDFRYANTWATMSATSKWWKAATGAVGPAPALAPMALGMAGACLALATIAHPAGRAGRRSLRSR